MKTDLYLSKMRVTVRHTLLAAAAWSAAWTAFAADAPTPRPPAAAAAGNPVLGATLDEVDGKLQVTRIETGGPADRAGVRRGDTLLSLGRDQMSALEDIAKALSRHRPQDKVALVVERDGTTRTLQAVLGNSRAAEVPTKRVTKSPAAASGDVDKNQFTTDDTPATQTPAAIDGQNLGKTAQGFAQMLRDMTGGLQRGDAATAPANRPRRPLLDRLWGADQTATPSTAESGDVQVDLGQESGVSTTNDLADLPDAAESQPREPVGAEAAAPRRGLGTRARPRLERLRDRLGKALDGAEAPAFEGSLLQPSGTPDQQPAPRVAGKPVPAADAPQSEVSRNRRASNQQPLSGSDTARPSSPQPALGVTLKLREAGVVVSAVTPAALPSRPV